MADCAATSDMGRSFKKKQRPKERWLLTRKTWRYMSDAGRKLIPDGIHHNHGPEDIPRIEAHFQEICRKEPRFLLWRKNSYPGAFTLRRKRKSSKSTGSSCRKVASANDVVRTAAQRPQSLPLILSGAGPSRIKAVVNVDENEKQAQLIQMLETYLNLNADDSSSSASSRVTPSAINTSNTILQLGAIRRLQQDCEAFSSPYSPNTIATKVKLSASSPLPHVNFNGDHIQKLLAETLSRYFSQSPNRDRIISNLLTDRKALEKLYFDLRRTKGFRGSRGGTGYTVTHGCPPSTYQHIRRRLHFGDHKGGLLADDDTIEHPPPLIEVDNETAEVRLYNWAIQTMPISAEELELVEREYRKQLKEQEEEERLEGGTRSGRRRSSVDNDDISQSVSDTIKRYLRMARKKSVDTDKADRFKRVNYDRNLRNIKAKGEITKPGDDDGLNKGCQTVDEWILTYGDLKFDELAVNDVNQRCSVDLPISPVSKSPAVLSKSHSFLSSFLHKHHLAHNNSDSSSKTDNSAAASDGATAIMQKSKSSSNVLQQGGKLVAKKIFRSRSKSQLRGFPQSSTACSWIPQGGCIWTNIEGKQVVVNDTILLYMTEIERKVLQKVALAKLQALNLGVNVKLPPDNIVGVASSSKQKRRSYLLKRTNNKKDHELKESKPTGGLVFGIPLAQCVENDRISKVALRFSHGECSASDDGGAGSATPEEIGRRHGSRTSFSSLMEMSPKRTSDDIIGSCENLFERSHGRTSNSVPGLLDTISMSSGVDPMELMRTADDFYYYYFTHAVPNILNACFQHLERYGLRTVGIFRVSTSRKRIRQLRDDFDCGREMNLGEDLCPHDVATLLKDYLRELPDPLLCRDLYHAFVQTQRIRNRRLQLEAIQHLLQLLPPSNRDTLYALLSFLALVAKHSADSKTESGDELLGNKMDSNNLATVFAPNILHCSKHTVAASSGASYNNSKETASQQERPEDRTDVINVVRTLIDHYKMLFTVPAELLDEVYVHMLDSYTEALQLLFNKRAEGIITTQESVEDVDSESWTASPTTPNQELELDLIALQEHSSATIAEQQQPPRRTYSREQCLHELAATGGPDIGWQRNRSHSRGGGRRREDSVSSSTARRRARNDATPTIIRCSSNMRAAVDTDPHQQFAKTRAASFEASTTTTAANYEEERRKSSPYVLSDSGVITASLTIPLQQPLGDNLDDDDDIPYIEDGTTTVQQQQFHIGGGVHRMQPSRGRQLHQQQQQQLLTTSSSDSSISSNVAKVAKSPTTSTSYSLSPDAEVNRAVLQRVSFTATQPVQQVARPQVAAVPAAARNLLGEDEPTSAAVLARERPTPTITSIGSAVLRSKTEDFEQRISASSGDATRKLPSKRRYADGRHPTRHIPDSDALREASSVGEHHRTVAANVTAVQRDSALATTTTNSSSSQIYKRRELISSVPLK